MDPRASALQRARMTRIVLASILKVSMRFECIVHFFVSFFFCFSRVCCVMWLVPDLQC
jgi:hypothetical protein